MPRPVHVIAVAALLVAGTTGAVVVAATDSPTEQARPAVERSEQPRADRERARTPEATGTVEPERRRDGDAQRAKSTRAANGARPASARRMVRATLRIPEIGLRGLAVVPYRGSPDDGPGTRIQDGGPAATPIGDRGGVGPGQIGNYIVTAHRTTSPATFADLPALRRGEHVYVRAAGRVFDYRITKTRWTSFRSQRSLAQQSAAVPGRPGVEPTRAMITLSTCATPEDHARGNYWSDEFGNPEHRIDKIGVLVDVRPAAADQASKASGD